MPAMLEDPARPPIYRTSGAPPYPTPGASEIPSTITPRQVTLRDRITIATLLPFSTATTVPPRLLSYLCQQFNLEIEKGDTYPMITEMPLADFGAYWFQNFGAIMLLGAVEGEEYIQEVWRMEEEGVKWEECALGSFYVKPNYPGRSSHVCNGGFLVTEAARNKGVGRLMGEGYLEWAPRLGYTYSVFNLVYETNVASCRIWDALGFKRVGRIKGCGNLRSSPDTLVDAIMYGRDLGPEGEDYVSEERFDKIRFYLKHGKYPNGADRAEKSRLRSAATHYKLLPPEEGREGEEDAERLMLRDKEVVSDPQRQYEIARQVHMSGQHGGINKTTATIAEKYHWVRIKETVSLVIKNCENCKDTAGKTPTQTPSQTRKPEVNAGSGSTPTNTTMIDRLISFDNRPAVSQQSKASSGQDQPQNRPELEKQNSGVTSPNPADGLLNSGPTGRAPMAHMSSQDQNHNMSQYSGIPLDPQIMQQSSQQMQKRQQQQQQPAVFQPHHSATPFPNYTHQQQQHTTTAPSSHVYPVGDLEYQPTTSHANPHKLSDGQSNTPANILTRSSIPGSGTAFAPPPVSSSTIRSPPAATSSRNIRKSNPRSAGASTAAINATNAATTSHNVSDFDPSFSSYQTGQLPAYQSNDNGNGTTVSNRGRGSGRKTRSSAAAIAAAAGATSNATGGANMNFNPASTTAAATTAALDSGGVGGGGSGLDNSDANFDVIMTDDAPADATSSSGDGTSDDMRLATDRHINMGDEPLGTR